MVYAQRLSDNRNSNHPARRTSQHPIPQTLSPTHREAINLAYSDGLTYQLVGAHLGIPLSTAETRIRDGLIRVKSSMEHT